jgi:hypothetical protein
MGAVYLAVRDDEYRMRARPLRPLRGKMPARCVQSADLGALLFLLGSQLRAEVESYDDLGQRSASKCAEYLTRWTREALPAMRHAHPPRGDPRGHASFPGCQLPRPHLARRANPEPAAGVLSCKAQAASRGGSSLFMIDAGRGTVRAPHPDPCQLQLIVCMSQEHDWQSVS